MRSVLVLSWALFFGLVTIAMSAGLQAPLLAVRAFDEGFDTSNTGLIMAGYYAGALVGALLAPKLIHQVGHAKVFAAVASIASGTALLFAVVPDAVFWFLLRVATGMCFATIYIVAETWLNQSSTNEIRGKVMNFYVILHYAGLGAGALMLNMGDPQGYELFILTSVLISFGIVPILLSAKPAPAFKAPKRISIAALFRKAPLGVGAAVLCGLAMGALAGAGAIFADKAGFSTAEVSIFMAFMSLGSLIFMWPVGILADRYDRSKIMIAVALLAALAAFLLAVTSVDHVIPIYLIIGLYAGLALSMYGLCLAAVNDELEPDEMVGSGATLAIIFNLGMMLGPVVSSEIIEAWRPSGYFFYHAAVQVLIALYVVALMTRRRAAPAP
ncbi:MFS transporter [Hoeflea sp. TYP-13]|uniref:MFS transporter n=1 Tax=Hoeflea sp. TYP-13 TaxID=3230023 RepID=UPI0034C6A356